MEPYSEKGSNWFSEELLTSFALFLSKEIQSFYQSEKGKTFYEKWLRKHPEYLPDPADMKREM